MFPHEKQRPGSCPPRMSSWTMGSRVVAVGKASDLAATRSWYSAAGFQVRTASPAVGATWLEVARDGLVLQFVAGATPWAGEPAFTGSFYVHVDDVDLTARELTAPVSAEWGVEDRAWGSRELTVKDPDGYFITFVQEAVSEPSGD